MAIKKSEGQTKTEQFLSQICDRTFLRLWSYPNPFKSDGKELCDLIAVFENHVFLFFDRESRKFDNPDKDIKLQWTRWEKEVIQKQIATAHGAARYIAESPDKLFLDQGRTTAFPIPIPSGNINIHKIIVAHGAEEACKNFSEENIYGSLAISYSDTPSGVDMPFLVHLDRNNPVHVFDSHNLEIILGELDTFYDFTRYLIEKEDAIKRYDYLSYCGEEDLLAHYFLGYDSKEKRYRIGVKDKDINGLDIGEGEWHDFIKSRPYQRRKEANRISYLWDELIQRTCQNALNGSLLGNDSIFEGKSAIFEMAKEPRFSRRALSQNMFEAISNFPENMEGIVRNLSFMPSIYPELGYVFLQLKHPDIKDYDNDYRPTRQGLLEASCGAAKIKNPDLKKIVGIAIDAPKFSKGNSEDFILMDCAEWTEEQHNHYDEIANVLGLFKSSTMKQSYKRVTEFPAPAAIIKKRKIGRNDPCKCGSGVKYKKCCGR